ncbi:adenylate kinase [Tessaracoccus sp. SD287]|uniref:adenylate kinase n=1 Tax=Tessaracoccus sp. SD287 TaxID=2782008 RepID=UPI001A96CB2B|nr:adenylate kinase [Tessaracoccus sp. SD287]
MNLLIMGAPGAGKGTQASRIAARYEVPAISTGSIFRENIANGTPLGVQVKQIMDAGQLVSDEITDAIVADRLGQEDAEDGWLLDGYPRNLHQVGALDRLLDASDSGIDAVISLLVDQDALVDRLLKRAEIEGRSDDNETTIRARMDVYAAETQPLLDTYRERGLLVEVTGHGSVDEVTAQVLDALDQFLAAKN